MKQIMLCLTMILLGLAAKAQKNIPANTAQTIWLYNNGKIIANQDDKVDKNYFNSEKIFLQGNPQLSEGQKFALIITPVKAESRVYIFENTELSNDLIQRILEQKKGTRIMFAKMHEQNKVMLSFILK